MAQQHIMPSALSKVVDKDGKLTPAWQRYFSAIEEMSGRVAVNVLPLAASPTTIEISTAFNALLTALQNSNQQQEAP